MPFILNINVCAIIHSFLPWQVGLVCGHNLQVVRSAQAIESMYTQLWYLTPDVHVHSTYLSPVLRYGPDMC